MITNETLVAILGGSAVVRYPIRDCIFNLSEKIIPVASVGV